MKIKIDSSNGDIDNYLRNNCDLGYLLDYLNQRKTNRDVYWLPITDVLRLIPEFEVEVQKVRNDLKIDPQKNLKWLENIVGRKNLLEEMRQIARGLKLLDLNDKMWNIVGTQIRILTRRYLPELTKRINKIRVSFLGKLQPSWHEAIERYILFEVIHTTPFIFRRPMPEIQGRIDPKTKEPYVEMRIYADTDISVLRRRDWWRKIQKSLPNYINLEKWDEDTVLKRFLHYVLRKHARYPHKRIYEWLDEKNFIIGELQHAGQEVSRFEILLKRSSK